MTRSPSRLVALLTLAVFAAGLSGTPVLFAGDGAVHGKITVEGGALPKGTVVVATPVRGGSVLTAPVGSDNTFLMPQLPEGSYKFEVVGPDGRVLGALKTIVPASTLQLNMMAWIKSVPPAGAPAPAPVAPPVAAPAPPAAAPAPSAASAPGTPAAPQTPPAPAVAPPAASAPAAPGPKPGATTQAAPEVQKGPPSKGVENAPQPKPAEAPRRSRAQRSAAAPGSKKKWALIASIVGGLGAGLAIGNNNNNNNNASPSQP